jgi:prepilin-type processing-associated H-X9-DG protein
MLSIEHIAVHRVVTTPRRARTAGIRGIAGRGTAAVSETRVTLNSTVTSPPCVSGAAGELSGEGARVNQVVRIGVTDGTTNCLMIGECSNWAIDVNGNKCRIDPAHNQSWMTGTNWTGTVPFPTPLTGRLAYNLTTIRYPPNSSYTQPGVSFNHGANNPLASAHEGGVHVLMCDGSVHFLSENIDLLLLKQLATRDDGNPAAVP